MFVDSGQADDARMAAVIAEAEPETIVAGAGLWLMDFPPHFLDAGSLRAYLLNFYVEPKWRGHGLAYKLLRTAVEETKRRGIGIVSLHASVFGKPLYERNGFKLSNEMLLRNT